MIQLLKIQTRRPSQRYRTQCYINHKEFESHFLTLLQGL